LCLGQQEQEQRNVEVVILNCYLFRLLLFGMIYCCLVCTVRSTTQKPDMDEKQK
jgi:hypothetical protein